MDNENYTPSPWNGHRPGGNGHEPDKLKEQLDFPDELLPPLDSVKVLVILPVIQYEPGLKISEQIGEVMHRITGEEVKVESTWTDDRKWYFVVKTVKVEKGWGPHD
jgi:hypothetical protein